MAVDAPHASMLVDRHGRWVSDIRVSLTNRCNFNCLYCHNEGLGDVQGPRGPAPDEMTADEVSRLLRIAREFEIRNVKFTGGEPLLRQDLEGIVEAASPFMRVSLTTNGSLLAPRAQALKAAGLERVNVSLDSLDPHHFQRIRRGTLGPVLKGIDAALAAGLQPVKINTVVMDETLDELEPLVSFVSERDGLELQLIELMPEIRHDLAAKRVAIQRVRAWLETRSDYVETRVMHHRRVYHLQRARVEVVDPVGNPEFCANCHRIRVTHDGQLKGCLNRLDDYVPTRGLDDTALRAAFRKVVRERVPYYGVYDRSDARLTSYLPASGADKLYASLQRPARRAVPRSRT